MSPDSSEQNPVSESFGLAQTDLKWIFTSLKASHLKHCINSFFFKLRKYVAEIDIVVVKCDWIFDSEGPGMGLSRGSEGNLGGEVCPVGRVFCH